MILPLKRYAEFGGRSRRKEYWMYTLFVVLVSVVTTLSDAVIGYDWASTGPINTVVNLGLLCPGLAVSFRRLHDVDRSAWWLLLWLLPVIGWIVLLVWSCNDGTRGTNQFGVDPKNPDGDLRTVFS